MRLISSAFVIATGILFAQVASAGVVMSETEVQNGVDGFAAVSKKVYVQGRKQKVETPDHQTIIDLDRGRIFVVDRRKHTYTETSFPGSSDAQPVPGVRMGTLVLRRTGETRRVAGYSCDEYQGVVEVRDVNVTVDRCISAQVPGAPELSAFQNALNSSLTGHRGSPSNSKGATGMALEERSVIAPRRPSIAPEAPTNQPLVRTRTLVDNIRVTALPADMFLPPANFHRATPDQDEGEIEV